MADAAKEKELIKSVQTYGRKKTATAVAYCKRGKGNPERQWKTT